MSKLLQPTVYRAVLYPLLGALGAVVAMMWPVGHKAFCAGITGLVI